MLQSTRNKVTLNILEKLKQQGAPASSGQQAGLAGPWDAEADPSADLSDEGDGSLVTTAGTAGLAELRKKAKKKLLGPSGLGEDEQE